MDDDQTLFVAGDAAVCDGCRDPLPGSAVTPDAPTLFDTEYPPPALGGFGETVGDPPARAPEHGGLGATPDGGESYPTAEGEQEADDEPPLDRARSTGGAR